MDSVDAMSVIERDREVCAAFSRAPYFPLVVKSGRGAIIADVDGKEYIDLLASAATINTGHCHPRIIDAITEQVKELIHYVPGYIYSELSVRLAEELVRVTPGSFKKKVAFGLSGSDAIDGMIKLVRAYTGRPKIVSFVQAYHGSTYGALSLSALSLNMRRAVGPLLPDVHHIPYPDCYRCRYGEHPDACNFPCLSEFREAMNYYLPPDEVAAVVMEPIAGDAGMIVPPEKYVKEMHAICRRNGILFVVDEVQQGFGRTGKWFSIEHFGAEADVLVMGKSMASGIPMSAIVARQDIMDALKPPGHVFSTGGSPVACRAALATIQVIEEEGLLARATEMGSYMTSRLRQMAEMYNIIGEVRGMGLTIGVDLVTDRKTKARAREAAAKICYRSYEKGVVMIYLAGNVLRIQPPLVITKEQVDRAVEVIELSIRDYLSGRIPDSVLAFATGWGL